MFKKKKQPQTHTPSLLDYQFHIDAVTPKLISGWAVNKLTDQTASIEVRANEQVIWQTQASQPRADLAQAELGDCAFTIKPDTKALTSDIETVDLFIDGFKANETPFPLAMKALLPEHYICHVDVIKDTMINGWCKHKHIDEHRVTIELKVDETTVASTIAEQFRSDLQDANIGDAQYGFQLTVDLALLPSETVTAEIYLDGKPGNIEPLKLSFDSAEFERAKFMQQFGSQMESFQQQLSNEQQRIAAQIAEVGEAHQSTSLNLVTNVAIANIAEISTRLNILERVVAEHLQKDR
ncbi:hypothetical protein [Vibrio variabilis]|uniref:hypothetical protein n=1 Tax=Vibrio variabilis TaxID=990271 RepID=UPI000DDA4790|nr:hypothetical protein [Vibrio variabilis]